MRSLGAGAALLGSSAGLSGAAAGQSSDPEEPLVDGIEAWDLTTTRIDASAVQDGPSVAFEGDEVVVTGSYVFSRTGCDTFAPRRLAYASDSSRLGVIVDAVPTDAEASEDERVCADALMPLAYELRVTPAGSAADVVVEETFADGDRSFHPRSDGDAGLHLVAAVTDYDLVVGPEAAPDGAEALAPSDAESIAPSATFDGGDVIVEGAMTYASSACNEIGLDRVRSGYRDSTVEVELEAQRQDTTMPGDDCPPDAGAAWYRLELIGSGDPPIQRCSVIENALNGGHTVSFGDGDGVSLPWGVVDYALDLTTTDDTDSGSSDPRVSLNEFDGFPAVIVRGTIVTDSSNCDTLELGALEWVGDPTAHLRVRVDSGERDTDSADCADDPVAVEYQLALQMRGLFPDMVTAEEGDGATDELLRRVRYAPYSSTTRELPDGISSYRLHTGSGDQADVDGGPEVSAQSTIESSRVSVEGTVAVGPCERVALADVRWADEEQSHLEAVVDVVPVDGRLDETGACPVDAPPMPTSYRIDLRSTIPTFVTAHELLDDDGEPVRTTTSDLRGTGAICGWDGSYADVDGATVCDVNDDGYYRDVNADGEVGQQDVAVFFTKQHRSEWKRPDKFDFSGNGRVTHGDVVELFDYVALN